MTTIPSFTMNNGIDIPALGYGVFQMTSDQVREHLPQALELGYRHIDTANAYFNEVAVGEVVRDAIAAGTVKREDLFITSKLFPQSYPYEQAVKDIDATLERLGLDYLDLLLFHQPYGEYTSGWKAMEEAVAAGKVRSIGLSNFPIAKFQEILDVASIKPVVNQVEAHPRWNQHELKAQMDRAAGAEVLVEAWYPLGHGDKTLLEEPAIAAAAQRTGASPAQVILAWHLAEKNITFPKTLNPAHMADNLAALDVQLTQAEIAAINEIPQAPYYVVPDEPPAFTTTVMDYSQQA
ncbi:Aldo/keto reductase [Actinomyces ruminicola]|uniref:Aldo/keto reductase n=1 Tax=Actinomyces ruminicola TaxID=332524 RepID=A0A1H0A041_9ACTO|nr:aldo/keto reductase [Actinomyces ruminicola]SDN26076.1 Aldo/keto reductase [Actinomyces ruminicola]